jgi:hypothetical protein
MTARLMREVAVVAGVVLLLFEAISHLCLLTTRQFGN